MTNGASLTVLVNSTDSYEDCWLPFFTLFKAYWPQCTFPIVLNSETKTFSFPGLNISSSRTGIDAPTSRPPWSDCLLRCLELVQTEYLLYLQEDYFLNDYVDEDALRRFLAVMEGERAAHIRLMEIGTRRGHTVHPRYPELWVIPQRADYRIGLQAGLWRCSSLKSYLRPGESAWEFERWGTWRARKVAEPFYCQSLELFNRQGRYIYPYVPTGIVRGRWYEPAVVRLFAQHHLEVDFSRRGFYRPTTLQRFVQRQRSAARRLFMRLAP